MLSILDSFRDVSGLRLNESKSHIIFLKKMSYPVQMGVVRNTCFRFSSSFGKYLGIMISPLKLKKGDYFSILDKTKDRIKGWQAKLLSMAGRNTLIKCPQHVSSLLHANFHSSCFSSSYS